VTLLRLALIALYTVVVSTTCIVACLVVPGGDALVPLSRIWSWLVLRTCGIRWDATYEPGLDPSRPSVYVANHQSLLDIPALILAMPCGFRFVAKRTLLHIPIFGWAIWLAGFILIDRSDREGAIRSLARAAERVRRGTSIIIFAEGTRSADGRLQPFKKGGFVLALQAGVPIVPVSIRGGHEVLPKGSMRLRPGIFHVVFGAPVPTSSYSFETRDDLIAVVRQRIAAGLETAAPDR
jgi:1-acyl-sn-glycerol-3-phosphate acyltransferase